MHDQGDKRIRLITSRTASLASVLALSLSLAGCGSARTDGAGTASASKTLTIYSSLPLRGAERTQTEPMVNGMKMALERRGHRVGPFKIRLESLDDSSVETGSFDVGATTANAQRAARDRSAVAYIGEYNSGASAVSIPILNAAGVPQVSPSNTAVGLTTDEPGAGRDEPEKYYPTGKRTFFRIAPKDTIQGQALASLMRSERCRRSFLLNDSGLYGIGLTRNIHQTTDSLGLRVVGDEKADMRASSYRRLATRIAARHADCVVFAGSTSGSSVQLFKDLAAAMPKSRLLAGDGLATSAFADPQGGGVPEEVGDRTRLTLFALDPPHYPESGRAFLRDYEQRFGKPDALAIYGYEAMLLMLDAIRRAGPHGDERKAVLEQLRLTRDRESVLGRYSFDDNGDTTLKSYGAYRIRNGRIAFDRLISPE